MKKNRVLALMTLMTNMDQDSLGRIKTLAKDRGHDCLEKAAYLLEKGISIEESHKIKYEEQE